MKLLEMLKITKQYPGVLALDHVNLDLDAGEVLGLMGENGAGKSTLIKILSGAIAPDGGAVRISGQQVRFRSPGDALAAGVAVIYQELVLCPTLNTVENILMGQLPVSRLGVIRWDSARQKVQALLESLGMDLPLDLPLNRLSVAERQLVAIAKALNRESQILVLDEPSAVLGSADLENLFRVIRTLRARGVGIVYISHRLEEVFEIADRALVMRDGQTIGSWPIKDLTMGALIHAMTGRDLDMQRKPHAIPTGAVRLEVKNLRRDSAFSNVTFRVKAGEIVGIAGLVGSGRTEVLRALYGADPPTGGEMRVDEKQVRPRSPQQAMSLGIGLVPEDRKLQGLLMCRDIKENISIASLERLNRLGILNIRQENQTVQNLVGRLRVACYGSEQIMNTLSGGNQQKVSVAKWLARHARILLFDEPTRGIDVGAKEEVYTLLNELAAEGVAILVVSSELKELFALASTILVMRKGQLVGEFSGESLREDLVSKAMLLGGMKDA